MTDNPTSGILDLGDMEKDSALEWVEAFRTFMVDQTVAVKIPVLYEHNNEVKYISFGKVPNDIMFDRISLKYAALMCAGYGVTLNDIGLQSTSSSGETLAGSIRSQRHSKATGLARVKAKVKYFFDRILPPSLQFVFIDFDTEDMTNLGRARLASATGFQLLQQNGNFSPQEIRSQAIQDGLFTISVPDELPPDAKPTLPITNAPFGKKPTEPEAVGSPKAPSLGGEGEVKSVTFKSKTRNLNKVIGELVTSLAPKISSALGSVSEDELYLMKSMIGDSMFSLEDELGLQALLSSVLNKSNLVTFKFSNVDKEITEWLGDLPENTDITVYRDELEENIKTTLNDFLGKSVAFVLTEQIFQENSFDVDNLDTYNLSLKVQEMINSSLPEFVQTHIRNEFETILNKIRNGE